VAEPIIDHVLDIERKNLDRTIAVVLPESGNPLGELPADAASMVENGTATQTISVPDGEVAAVAAYAINRQHNSVV